MKIEINFPEISKSKKLVSKHSSRHEIYMSTHKILKPDLVNKYLKHKTRTTKEDN